jgi:hypothetical protein
VTIKYLAHVWGVNKNFPTNLLRKQHAPSKPKTISPGSMSVIDSFAAAKIRYSTKSLFIANRIRERSEQEKVYAYEKQRKAERQHLFREEAKAEWVIAERHTPEVIAYWESMSRRQIARQPLMRDTILELLRANPSKSFANLAEDIGHWCSAGTIHKWIQTRRNRQQVVPGQP